MTKKETEQGGSGHRQQEVTTQEDAIFHYMFLLHSITLVETGIGRLLHEAQHHVGNVVGFLLNSIFANNAKTSWEHLAPEDLIHLNGRTESFDEPPPDPPLSPARVTRAASSNSIDEWGHFADFQDELADEKSFIPSCVPTKASLERLDEDDDFDVDADAFSF